MKYFTIEELCKSNTARENDIINVPSRCEIEALEALVNNILDPLREAFGRPIIVTSGYRCFALNAFVGGARDSQHRYGEAADIEANTRTKEDNRRLFELICSLKLPFDQLINEYDYDWIHVSFSKDRCRQQVLKAERQNGKTIYTKVI